MFDNLLLLFSVRLGGPVKGRGTIFRNLGLDMQRMKDAGVRCLVWYVPLPLSPTFLAYLLRFIINMGGFEQLS